MTGRDWKPGDVVIDAAGTLGILTTDGGRGSNEAKWIEFASGVTARPDDVVGLRSLVVIDPEDREQVERLRALYLRDEHNLCDDTADCMADALREFADPKPPKPEEPTGLGAVVEDAEGRRWIRVVPRIGYFFWQSADEEHISGKWSGLDVVRVLSEGVQA